MAEFPINEWTGFPAPDGATRRAGAAMVGSLDGVGD